MAPFPTDNHADGPEIPGVERGELPAISAQPASIEGKRPTPTILGRESPFHHTVFSRELLGAPGMPGVQRGEPPALAERD
jgi:hypothetical protein